MTHHWKVLDLGYLDLKLKFKEKANLHQSTLHCAYRLVTTLYTHWLVQVRASEAINIDLQQKKRRIETKVIIQMSHSEQFL